MNPRLKNIIDTYGAAIRESKYEHILALDAEDHPFVEVVGDAHRVTMSYDDAIHVMQVRNSVLIHNHVTDIPFSFQDVRVAFASQAVASILITPSFTYILMPPKGAKTFYEMAGAWRIHNFDDFQRHMENKYKNKERKYMNLIRQALILPPHLPRDPEFVENHKANVGLRFTRELFEEIYSEIEKEGTFIFKKI